MEDADGLDDRFTSPLSDFQREVAAAGLANRVTYLRHGETYEFGATARRTAARP